MGVSVDIVEFGTVQASLRNDPAGMCVCILGSGLQLQCVTIKCDEHKHFHIPKPDACMHEVCAHECFSVNANFINLPVAVLLASISSLATVRLAYVSVLPEPICLAC